MGIPATGLTRDRVEFLLREFASKFAGRPTFRRAIMSVLEPISDGWANHGQGMTRESFDRMNAALVSPIEALLVVTVDQAEHALDQLSAAWERVRDDLEWVG